MQPVNGWHPACKKRADERIKSSSRKSKKEDTRFHPYRRLQQPVEDLEDSEESGAEEESPSPAPKYETLESFAEARRSSDDRALGKRKQIKALPYPEWEPVLDTRDYGEEDRKGRQYELQGMYSPQQEDDEDADEGQQASPPILTVPTYRSPYRPRQALLDPAPLFTLPAPPSRPTAPPHPRDPDVCPGCKRKPRIRAINGWHPSCRKRDEKKLAKLAAKLNPR
jgi:hypothetical protein